jgi:hypothetical protein
MHILIAGGSGLIGEELTARLVINGHDVTILSRKQKITQAYPENVRVLRWDGVRIDKWADEISNNDVIINLAGENLSGKGLFPLRWTTRRKVLLLRSRVDAGKVLTLAIENAKRKPFLFVQASGIGIYGMERERIVDESSELGSDYMANLAKQWEASSEPIEDLKIRRVVIRTGVVLSGKGGALRSIVFPYKYYIGGRIGDGQQYYSWIHIKDEVNAILFLIENENAKGVFNLSSPNPVTNNEFGKTISKTIKRPHYFPIPGFFMHLVFGEVANMVLEGQRVYPTRLLKEGFKFKYADLPDALLNIIKEK